MKAVTAEILTAVGVESVRDAIRAELTDETLVDMTVDLIVNAADRFLVSDLTEYDRAEVELPWSVDGARGTFDLVLVDGSGRVKIVDWKTAPGNLPPNYADEHRESWQTYMYLGYGREWLAGRGYGTVEVMDYRIVSRDEKGSACRVLTVPFEARFRSLAEGQLLAVSAAYATLTTVASHWPKRLPYQCFKGSRGGATCPWWGDCTHGTEPLVALTVAEIDAARPERKSWIGQFLDCPERYRRDVVLGHGDEGSYAVTLGAAFARGVEVLWREAFRVRGSR